jgi:chemotaxis protein CheY-P-specific phosphatase CheC
MSNGSLKNSKDLQPLSYLLTRAITCAIADIGPAIGQRLSIDSIKTGQINRSDVPDLLGDSESLAIGNYSTLSGEIGGHVMIAHKPDLILRLINVDQEALSSLNERKLCTIGEIENTMSKGFIKTMEDMLSTPLHAASSVVLVDKVIALLNIAFNEFLHENDNMFVAETMITTNGQSFRGQFIIMMDHNFIQRAHQITAKV